MADFQIFVGTVLDPTQGTWFNVPVNEAQVIATLENQYGVQEGQEIMISDYEVPGGIEVDPYGPVTQLNEVAENYDDLDPWVQKNLQEIADYTGQSINELVENSEDINYIEATDDEELGEFLVDEGGYSIPAELEDYIDYEALGRDTRINDGGTFIDGRYIW